MKGGQKKEKKGRVAVVIPLFRIKLKDYEVNSLINLREKLYGKYDIFIVTKKENKINIESHYLFKGYGIELFDEKFSTYQGYNKLCKSTDFYNRFSTYEYMLIFQSDCFLFGKDLDQFLRAEIDYIGAPWIEKTSDGNLKFIGAGNGGLSLRKINKFIKIIRKYEKMHIKVKVFLKFFTQSIRVICHKLFKKRDYPIYHIGCRNEDIFWSQVAPEIDPKFKLANIEESLIFAFEKHPEFCYEKTSQLPFGLHAYQKFSIDFIKKHT